MYTTQGIALLYQDSKHQCMTIFPQAIQYYCNKTIPTAQHTYHTHFNITSTYDQLPVKNL